MSDTPQERLEDAVAFTSQIIDLIKKYPLRLEMAKALLASEAARVAAEKMLAIAEDKLGAWMLRAEKAEAQLSAWIRTAGNYCRDSIGYRQRSVKAEGEAGLLREDLRSRRCMAWAHGTVGDCNDNGKCSCKYRELLAASPTAAAAGEVIEAARRYVQEGVELDEKALTPGFDVEAAQEANRLSFVKLEAAVANLDKARSGK